MKNRSPAPLAALSACNIDWPVVGASIKSTSIFSSRLATPSARAGPNAKRLLRFTHLADTQVADDESPTRLGQFDADKVTASALRPQDAYLCHMANATVRTINALHKKDPIAFTLLGGDNGDSVQTNEESWILGILSGSDDVECDSGDDGTKVTCGEWYTDKAENSLNDASMGVGCTVSAQYVPYAIIRAKCDGGSETGTATVRVRKRLAPRGDKYDLSVVVD